MYEVAERIKVKSGTSLGDIYDPYFDRAAKHFSGHVNTPSQPDPSGYDAGSEKGGFTYIAHPIFTAYKRIGAVAMLEIAEKVIERALGTRRMIETSLPRAGRATLRRQAGEKRDVLHLLHATPALRGNIRGDSVQPIQDLVTLGYRRLGRGRPEECGRQRSPPPASRSPSRRKAGRVAFTVPKLTGHQMVEIAY